MKIFLKSRYEDALIGRKIDDNPYVFFTSSLLYVIQHAISKTRGNKETNAHIVCVDTRTARRPDGQNARFYPAVPTMMLYEMSIPRARWTYKERDYSDVWVTTDRVVPGEGSYHVAFEKLKAVGLYKLFPEFAFIARRNKPGLESPVNDLRQLWYKQRRDLPFNEINLAAQLAAAFSPVREEQELVHVPTNLLAWFIALKGQRADGKRLKRWLKSHDSRPQAASASISRTIPCLSETDRFHQIHEIVSRYNIRVAKIKDADVSVGRARMRMQVEAYKHSKKSSNESRD